MAQSYLHNTSRTAPAGAAAEMAADKKTAKYALLILFQLSWKRWEPSTATDLNSLVTWEGALHKSQMISASLPSCSSACQFLFSATMRSPSRAPLPTQPLRTNFRPFQPICFFFKLLFITLGIFTTEGKNTKNNNDNNNNICISEFRCWCSVSILFCYTTACRSLTARSEHHTLSVFINFINF